MSWEPYNSHHLSSPAQSVSHGRMPTDYTVPAGVQGMSPSRLGCGTAPTAGTTSPSLQSRRYSCRYCPKTFTRKADRNRHAEAHSEAPSFECPMPRCDHTGPNGFSRRDDLVQHLRTVHAAQQRYQTIANRRRASRSRKAPHGTAE